ncbi:MAG: thiamine pyrophosphate-binding protein [Candidatus Hydrogenedentales bacterium]|jgi:acetolactate synthase-1/2/3 large subunit
MAHGGKLVARALKRAGVDCIFTLSGGHIMPIYDGCLDEGIRIVDVRHEQAAAHAADAWSRVSPGKIGVAVVTAGPGVTDAVTGVANAWRANSPCLLIGGQGPFANTGRGSLQEMDHVSLMKPITKYSATCYDTERIPEYIEKAIRHAVSGTPGPSFLELPIDILMNEADVDKAVYPAFQTSPPMLTPRRDDVLAALRLLQKAERPVVMAGTSVKWSCAQPQLNAFLARTNIPAYANGMGRGAIPRDSKHLFNRTRRKALTECDVLILAGVLLDFRMNFGRDIPESTKIIQLEMDNLLIGHNRAADIALVGNLACSIDAMLSIMDEERIALDFAPYSATLRTAEDATAKETIPSDAVPIETPRFCHEIAQYVGKHDDMIIIGDGGDVVAAAAKVVPIPKNGGWMDPGPLGTLGVGMPFALAAQLAHPDKKVLVIYGDGSFGLNGFEFDTAVRFNLPIVAIVGNDAAWGQMLRPQLAFYKRLAAVQLNHTRYDRVVEAMGGYGELVENPNDIQPALQRAYASGKPACINVILKQEHDFKGGAYI